MNCIEFNINLNALNSDELPEEVKLSMYDHIAICESCRLSYTAHSITEKIIEDESAKQVDPFLSTRIMAEIESREMNRESSWTLFFRHLSLRPALITATATAAIFFGIFAGITFSNTIGAPTVPGELVYMNDAAMESLPNLLNE